MKLHKHIFSFIVILSIVLSQLAGCAQAGKNAALDGNIIEIEEFGHAVLDITPDDFYNAGFELGDIVSVEAGGYKTDMPCFSGYYADAGGYMVRIAPDDTNIALCINYGNFTKAANLDIGDTVTITLKEKGAALATQELLSMEYSDEPEDFDSVEAFSNFRLIELGNIGERKIYRSASPINNERSRASVTNTLIENAEINTIINMADSDEKITRYISSDDFDSEYYNALWENGNVLALDMTVDFRSDEFAQKLIDGFTFIAQNEGPYLIHCNEGKDRTGFACMLIEMLMGAGLQDIIADYMLSYRNYYDISASTDENKYQLILENNLMEMLRFVAEVDEGESFDNIDLSVAAENWLLSRGMDDDALKALKQKLH